MIVGVIEALGWRHPDQERPQVDRLAVHVPVRESVEARPRRAEAAEPRPWIRPRTRRNRCRGCWKPSGPASVAEHRQLRAGADLRLRWS